MGDWGLGIEVEESEVCSGMEEGRGVPLAGRGIPNQFPPPHICAWLAADGRHIGERGVRSKGVWINECHALGSPLLLSWALESLRSCK